MLENARARGAQLMAGLRALQARYPQIWEVCCRVVLGVFVAAVVVVVVLLLLLLLPPHSCRATLNHSKR